MLRVVTGGGVCLGMHWKGRASEVAPEAVRQAVGRGLPKQLGAVTVGHKCHGDPETPGPVLHFPHQWLSTLQIRLSWERLCVEHRRRRRARDAKGPKQHL